MQRRSPAGVQPGDHACTLFDSREELLLAASDHIRAGFARGERCIYVCCELAPRDFRAALWKAGIDVDAQEVKGALVLLTRHNAHLKDGIFDVNRTLATIAAAATQALQDGFTGLCIAGEMTWLLDGAPGSDRIVEYETRLNELLVTSRVACLCQYNRRLMPAALLDHCLATHPIVRMPASTLVKNPFYEQPAAALSRIPNPGDVERKIGQLHYAASAD